MSSGSRPPQYVLQQQQPRKLSGSAGGRPTFPMSKASGGCPPPSVTMTYVPVHGGGTQQQLQQQMRQQQQQSAPSSQAPPAAHSFPAMVTINASALQMSFPTLPSVPLPPAVLNGLAAANAQHHQQITEQLATAG